MNFLDHYVNYAAVNESPKLYHIWSGLSLLSHLIGRRVWTEEQMWRVHCNMYICLVGPPGIAKSTAMNVAKDFIRDNYPTIFAAPASITKEAIIETMANEKGGCIITFPYNGKTEHFSQMSVFANEMVSLLSSGGNIIGMIEFLTDVWDQPVYRDKTKNKGDNTINHPFITILGCFTTDTAKALMHSKIITGGMSRRCIFVCADKNRAAVPRIKYTAEQLASKEACIHMAKKITNFTGPFTWSDEAEEFYDKWYRENYARSEKVTSDVLKHFLRSKTELCTKVSMLLALADPNPQLVHSVNTFKKATELVTEIENGASILFDSSGRNELASITTDVEKFIRDNTPVTSTQLYTKFWNEIRNGDKNEIDLILEHLQRAGKIRSTTTITNDQATKEITWIGT